MLVNFQSIKLIFGLMAFVFAASSIAGQQLHGSSADKLQVGLIEQPASAPSNAFSSDVMFNILVGEIALQREDMDLAYKHLLEGASLAKDAVAAERATRIALYKKDSAGGLAAVKIWIEFDPKSIKARQIAVMMYVQSGDSVAALEQLKRLVKLNEADGQDQFSQALVAVASGKNNDLALSLMQSLALEYASNAEARYAVALVAVMAKKLDIAEAEVRQAISIDPKMEKAYVLLGRIFMEGGDNAKAMAAMQQSLQQMPKSKELRSAYARLLIDMNKPELAYQQFQQLSQLSSDNTDAQFSMGILALELKRYQQAKSHFSALMKSQRRTQDAIFYLGRTAEMEEKIDDALEWYGKVASGKYLFNAQARMVALVAAEDSLQKARAMLGGMRTRMPERSIDIYILEGDILRKHSTQDKVVELFNAALVTHPNDLDLLYARALSASVLGRLDILERDIGYILKQEPNHADALNALGYTLADQTDRYQEALSYIKKALELKPDSPAILDSMGWVQYRLGNNKEALEYLRRAFEQVQDGEVAAHLGELLWVTGNKQEAQSIIQEALKKHPDNKYLLKTVKRLGI